jgi:KDO2-lipid IV(A) lauroyltransferase
MSDTQGFSYRLLAPQHWPTWSGLGLLRLLIRLPYAWLLRIGTLLGRTVLRFSPARRHIADVNLRLCFPDMDDADRAALIRRHFESLGIGAIETALSWWAPAHKLEPLAHVDGLTNLTDALARGKGVILLSAHFTTLEIGGRLLALHAPFHVMYREHKNELFEAIMRRAREIHFEKAIPRNDIRGMIRSLRDNRPVWYAQDQNYKGELSMFVPFFGIPASTITATSKLARMSGAAVVPFFQHRLPDGSGYRIVLLPALEDYPTEDVGADTLRINRIIEAQILQSPEQYLWVHRRFKTRPGSEADVYTGT